MTEKIIKATADGRNGQIDFDIKVGNNQIADINVTKTAETPGIFNQVVGKLKKNIINNQSFDVDAISGASIMTQAMLDSGKKALKANDVNVVAK
ncbi:MAG: FMN-binding protein, partial [Lactobacillus sp.]|nr:FMN-binding protein [Lactobacillus sp.]